MGERTFARNLKDCPIPIRSKCYKTFVHPILEYGNVVWGPHHCSAINRLDRHRSATGNYKFEPGITKTNMSFLNRNPLEERRAATKLNIFYRASLGLVEIPSDHLPLASSLGCFWSVLSVHCFVCTHRCHPSLSR